ncbi:glycosyltransferase family 2 protein [Streptomyces sp. LE64]|uniref:glycosyltransferase family 2 protein n=1 Tax=Streptomyces sp. LE64 TaxID=3448653 RepID=UPI00404172FD
MSLHSRPPGHHTATAAASAPPRPALSDPTSPPEHPRHVVTAVVVAHDGARWLPETLAGLLGQTRPVQNVVAADTGSADDSARLLTEALGADRVLNLARRTGFGQAVDEAVRTAPVLTPDDLPYLKRPSGWDPATRTWHDDAYDLPELPHGEPEQWLWLLHDDCAPEPDALDHLLRAVENERALTPSGDGAADIAVVGPKLRGWYDRRQLLEVGVTIAPSGRRWTGLDRREQDQGQHDQVRPVLAVSTAGMLIRREVFDRLGGFDRHLPLMRDDVDFCWRAHHAGHRVLVAPEAGVRHAEAASRERRSVDCAGRGTSSPHKVDKAGASYALLANTRTAALPWVLVRLVLGTVLRALAYLVGKVPGQALDEVTGLAATLLRPGRVLAARRSRGRPRTDRNELRPLFPPPGATLRAALDQLTGNLVGASDTDTGRGGRHGAVESGPGGDDADFLEVEQFARLKRVGRKPGPVLFALLLLCTLVATRALLGTGALTGGALLPAPADAADLWARYTDAWHPVGTGGTQSAPPHLAFLALLGSVLFGSTGLAVSVVLLGAVPLAGVTAYLASRPLVMSRLLRAWAAVAYAFLPAVTGAVAGGRIGTAVLAVLLPLLARAGVAASGLARPGTAGSWRATWAFALLLTVTTAFTPVVWPLALALGLVLLAVRRRDLLAHGARALVALATPLLVLAPWSLTLLPTGFLTEAGLDHAGPASDALDLLGASPGGSGTVGGLLLTGVVLAALAALLRTERRTGVLAAWTTALVALVLAALSNGATWAGPATLVYGLALLGAAILGADGARHRVAEQSFGWRQPVAALIAFAAAAGTFLAAAGWMIGGAHGPLERRDPVQVPAFVAEESRTQDQARTLVLDGDGPDRVAYTLVRGSGARLGDAELAAAAPADPRLDRVVAHLVAGSGADQADELGGYAVRYVLVRDGAPRTMSRVLDTTPGLSRLSEQDGDSLWRVDRQVSRAAVVPASGDPQPVAAGPVEIHTELRPGPEGRVLRLADSAAPGWTATLDGEPLTAVTVDGWAQGFRLPASGGRLDVTYATPLTHTAWQWTQAALVLVLVVLALPGRRRQVDDDLPGETPPPPPPAEGRRARRLREEQPAPAEPPPPAPVAPPVPHQAAPPVWDPPPPDPSVHPGAVPPQADHGGGYDGYGYDGYGGYDPAHHHPGTAPQDGYAPYDQPVHPPQTYGQDGYGSAAFGAGGYDPPAPQPYDPYAYGTDPGHPSGGHDHGPHGTDRERPEGSQQ